MIKYQNKIVKFYQWQLTLQRNNAFTSAEQVSVKLKNYLRSETEISLAIKGKYLINNEVEITEGNDYKIKVENSTTLTLYANGVKVTNLSK